MPSTNRFHHAYNTGNLTRVKETNFELQRGKLQCPSGDWSSWFGSTNLAIVKITDSICLLMLKVLRDD